MHGQWDREALRRFFGLDMAFSNHKIRFPFITLIYSSVFPIIVAIWPKNNNTNTKTPKNANKLAGSEFYTGSVKLTGQMATIIGNALYGIDYTTVN